MGTKTTFLLFQIEKLPWDSGKANACGGDARPAVDATAISSETGKPIREDGKPLPFRHGEMSRSFQCASRGWEGDVRIPGSPSGTGRSPYEAKKQAINRTLAFWNYSDCNEITVGGESADSD